MMLFGQQVERINEGELQAGGLSAMLVVFEMCEMVMGAQSKLVIEVLPVMVMKAEMLHSGFDLLCGMVMLVEK